MSRLLVLYSAYASDKNDVFGLVLIVLSLKFIGMCWKLLTLFLTRLF